MVSLRPRYPILHMSAFRISESDECLIVKDWRKMVNDRREVLGAAMRSAAHDQKTGSSACSSMMNQESYACSMLFYLRGSSRSDLASSCALSTCPLMSVFFVLNLISKCDLLVMNAYSIMTMLNSMISLLLVQVNVSSLSQCWW